MDSDHKIIRELVLRNNPLTWSKIEDILDDYMPLLMKKITEIPAYQIMLKDEGLNTDDIKNFDDFNKKMPIITPEIYFKTISKLGTNAFMPQSIASDNFLSSSGYEYFYNQHALAREKAPLTMVSSQDDIIASAIGLASALRWHFGNQYQKFSLHGAADNSFVKHVTDQALIYAQSIELSNPAQKQFFPPNHNHNKTSDYGGFFPTHLDNFIVPFPNLMYAVDNNGHKTNSVGTFVVSNLFSLSENPFGINSILKRGINFIMENESQKDITPELLKRLIGQQYYEILLKMYEKPINDYNDLKNLSKQVILNWIKQDLIVGAPKGTIFLKFAIPVVGAINENLEILHQEAAPRNIKIAKGRLFLHRHSDYPIRHQPYFLRNIIAGEIRDSPIGVRVHDITLGHHKEHYPKGKEYLYFQPSVLRKDVEDALLWSQEKSKIQHELTPTIDDIHKILSRLHEKISNDKELQNLAVRKIGVPIREIKEMLIEAHELIQIDNLKKLAYCALVDHKIDFKELNDESEIEKGIQAIHSKSPLCPFYFVTASNINPLDWFKIMSESLLASLSGKPIVYNVRSSESDLFSSYSLYHFDQIVKECVPDAAKKGLIGVFQRLFWNPNTHPEYGIKFMKSARGSMSFGTLKSFKKYSNIIKKDASNHILYKETVNAAIILNNFSAAELDEIAGSVLEKCYKLRGCDCTSLQDIFVHNSIYDAFYSIVRDKASKLTYGDITDEQVQLAWHSPIELKKLESSIKKAIKPENYEIIAPISVEGIPAKKGIIPEKGISGVVIVKIDVESDKIAGDNKNGILVKHWLAKQLNVPLLNLIRHNSYEDIIKVLNNIIVTFEKDTGYNRYTYISLFGGREDIRAFKPLIEPMTDLILENTLKFNPLQPHNRRYFLRDVLGLGPIE